MKRSLTTQCILGLLLGLVVGTAASGLHPEALAPWLDGGGALIQMWTNALRLLVIPLVMAQLFVAIAGHKAGDQTARLGLIIPVVFVALFAITAFSAIVIGAALLRLPILANLSLSGVLPPSPEVAATGAAGPYPWLTGLVPANLVAAAAGDAILPLMIFTFAFACAARRLAVPLLHSLETVAQAVRDTMFVLVGWLMQLAPPILFALAFRSASRFGLELGGALLAFVVIWTIVLICCLALQYPVAWLGAGLSMRRFARALFPAQMAAVTGRSSIATVPILLREAEATLELPPGLSSVVIPTGASVLKLSQAVSPPLRLLFLATVLGLALGPRQLIVFMATIIVLSPGIVGIPRVVSGSKSLPAYVAAGIPPEYVLLLGPLNALMDPLLTALNTTGYMTANALIARRASGRVGVGDARTEPVPTSALTEMPNPN